MTTTQRYCLFGLCLIALVMPVNTSGAYNDIHVPLDDESQEIITRGVLSKQITIVPQLNKLNFGLGRYDGVSFYFKKMLYLPDLAVEMEIKKEWSELLHDYEPLMEGSARQTDLSNLGKRILRNWPVALLGYDYSFQLIKSSKMNAIAIPTGKIVVSTTLLEALENEEEREALLSLAIAHIELRHSLRQYQLKLSASQDSDAMRSLVKAAGSVAGIFPGGSLIDTLGSLTFNPSVGARKSVLGFDDDFDRQADAMAALYFDLYHESRENLSALIQKMQLAQMTERLHPELGDGQKELYFNDRIKRVENTKFLYLPDENSFLFEKENQLPVQLDLIYQSIIENESKLVLYINDRSLLSDFRKFNGGKTISIFVQDKNGTQKFNLLEKFTTEDLWGASLTFRASGKKNGHFIRDAKSIKLELTRPGKASDRREEPIVEQFMFVRGKLEY